MANPDSVAQNTASNFGNYAIASATAVPLGTTGNAVVALPILGGGLTVGGNAATSGAVIVRRVTVQNPSGNVATGNVSIITSNDGNAQALYVKVGTAVSGTVDIRVYGDTVNF